VRLLVIEFITAGGCHDSSLPLALAQEGEFMLQAVLRDARELSNLQVTVPRDARMHAPSTDVRTIAIDGDPWPAWRALAAEADAVLAIAPETDGVLERLNSMILAQGVRLLGCSVEAVGQTASKLATADRLRAHGIEAALTVRADDAIPSSRNGWIVKPDDGVGSEDVWAASTAAELRQCLQRVPDPIVQPLVSGDAISLSLLCTTRANRVLACNRQMQVFRRRRLRQVGVEVNGAHAHAVRLSALAGDICAVIPGLKGYVGVDLILTDTGPVVLEINPRLTTAYAGLSASIGCNALDLVLRACDDDDMAMNVELQHRPVQVMPHRHG
jgi:tyramine---L-glutamate ligase